MLLFEPNSHNLREVLIFCSHLKKMRLRIIECFQVLTVGLLIVKERIVSSFNVSRAVILMSRTGMAVEKKKFSKIPNWRHYLLKTCSKCKKNG